MGNVCTGTGIENANVKKMELEQLKSYTDSILKMTVRSIKPWHIKRIDDFHNGDYVDGWNDCIEEMTKNWKKFYAHIKKRGAL